MRKFNMRSARMHDPKEGTEEPTSTETVLDEDDVVNEGDEDDE